jgi:opacity protein-like surface antigen
MKDSSASFFRYLPEGNPMYLVDAKIDINYIVIPLLINVHFGKTFSAFINTGPYVGIKLNARCTGMATTEYSGEDGYTLKQVNVYDDIEGLIRNDDWGWVFGGGIGIPVFHKYKLDIELRYSHGFVNIYEPLNNNTNGGNSDDILKNQSLQLTAGFKVPLY